MLNSSHGGAVPAGEDSGQDRFSPRSWVRWLPQSPGSADGPRPLGEVASSEAARQADPSVADRSAVDVGTTDPPPAHSPPAVATLGVVAADPGPSGVAPGAVTTEGVPVSDALDGPTALTGHAWTS